MSESLVDLLGLDGDGPGRIHGVVRGVVTNVKDPDDLGRVRVAFPWLDPDVESWWARVAVPMAGAGRGTYFLPEVDDEVLIAFEHGDPAYPYVIGSLWNAKAKPPESNAEGKNNLRTITSRAGHVIRLDDTEGEEKIEVVDKTGKNSVVITAKDNTITITADADVTVTAPNGKLALSAKEVEITSRSGLRMKADTNLEVTAGAQLKLKGQVVNIN